MQRIALCAALVAVAACDADERWLAVVYPDRNDLTNYQIAGEYSTIGDCLDAARREAGPSGAYECGLNCTQRDSMNVCERTVGNER